MALYEKLRPSCPRLLGKGNLRSRAGKGRFARTKAVEDKVQGYVTVAEESALAQAEAVDKARERRYAVPRWPVSRSPLRTTSAPRAR